MEVQGRDSELRSAPASTEILSRALKLAEKGSDAERLKALELVYHRISEQRGPLPASEVLPLKGAELTLLLSLGRAEDSLTKSIELLNMPEREVVQLGVSGIRESFWSLLDRSEHGDIIEKFKGREWKALGSALRATEKLSPVAQGKLAESLLGVLAESISSPSHSFARSVLNSPRFAEPLEKLGAQTGSSLLFDVTRQLSLGYGEKAESLLLSFSLSRNQPELATVVAELALKADLSGGRRLLEVQRTLLSQGYSEQGALLSERLLLAHGGRLGMEDRKSCFENLQRASGRSKEEVELLIAETQRANGQRTALNLTLQVFDLAQSLLLSRGTGRAVSASLQKRLQPVLVFPDPPKKGREALVGELAVNGTSALGESTKGQTTNRGLSLIGGRELPQGLNTDSNRPKSPAPLRPPLLPGARTSSIAPESSPPLALERLDTQSFWKRVKDALPPSHHSTSTRHLFGEQAEKAWARAVRGQTTHSYSPLDFSGIDVVVDAAAAKQISLQGIPIAEVKSQASWSLTQVSAMLPKDATKLKAELSAQARLLESGKVNDDQLASILGIDKSFISDGYVYGFQVKSSMKKAYEAKGAGHPYVVYDVPRMGVSSKSVMDFLKRCFSSNQVADGELIRP